MLRIYKMFNLLSFDIVLGAICSALFFGALLKVDLRWPAILALAITVWIVYVADRLRDAKKIDKEASSERHQFHQKNFSTLFRLLILAVCADVVVILYMRKPILYWGVGLSLIVGIYLLVQRYLKFLKEVFVAVLYSFGVLLPSLALTSIQFDLFLSLLVVQFLLAALINLLVFSWYDRDEDLIDHQASFATAFGRHPTKLAIAGLSIANFCGTIFFWIISENQIPSLIMSSMTAVLLMLVMLPNVFRRCFRIIGDAVFFLPSIYLLWQNH